VLALIVLFTRVSLTTFDDLVIMTVCRARRQYKVGKLSGVTFALPGLSIMQVIVPLASP
jgi:hypothetical protein